MYQLGFNLHITAYRNMCSSLCYKSARGGIECEEEEREDCPNLDDTGICKPRLVKFRCARREQKTVKWVTGEYYESFGHCLSLHP